MAYSTRCSSPKLDELDMDHDRLMRAARQRSNTPSVPAADDDTRNVASTDGNRLSFWLHEDRCAANGPAGDNQTNEDEAKRGSDFVRQ